AVDPHLLSFPPRRSSDLVRASSAPARRSMPRWHRCSTATTTAWCIEDMTMTGSMTAADRETLCALLDGELAGDERRFALRRLSHDADWQRAAASWHLAGDALRGEAVLPA